MKNLIEVKAYKASLTGMLIGLVVGIVLIFAVGVPVATDVISSASLTGTNATIAAVTITFMCLIPVVLISQMF